MYGTVARFRLKPGMDAELLELTRAEIQGDPSPGFVALYLNRLDADPQAYTMTVIFASRAHYVAHATTPAAHARYQQIRALLEDDPTWHDGTVVLTYPLSGGA